MEPAQQCYQLTESIPDSEKFGLVSLVRRAAVSFPPNIAEGNGRGTTGEFIQFLRIAQGSWKELETQLILSQGLGFIAAGTEHATLSNAENLGK